MNIYTDYLNDCDVVDHYSHRVSRHGYGFVSNARVSTSANSVTVIPCCPVCFECTEEQAKRTWIVELELRNVNNTSPFSIAVLLSGIPGSYQISKNRPTHAIIPPNASNWSIARCYHNRAPSSLLRRHGRGDLKAEQIRSRWVRRYEHPAFLERGIVLVRELTAFSAFCATDSDSRASSGLKRARNSSNAWSPAWSKEGNSMEDIEEYKWTDGMNPRWFVRLEQSGDVRGPRLRVLWKPLKRVLDNQPSALTHWQLCARVAQHIVDVGFSPRIFLWNTKF